MSDRGSDPPDDDANLPAFVLEAKQGPPCDTRCEWCHKFNVHSVTRPVRIYYHCTNCLHSWSVRNPKAR
jgi:ssDNA-binding Zn-finger/Zn-ribbon topoisomerase 1